MDPRKNVTVSRMILLNVVNFGLVGFWSFDGATMPLFLTSKFGLPNLQIALIQDIGKLMICCSVLFGIYTDLTQFKWGKRRPLMLIGGVLSAAFIVLIPNMPQVWMLVAVMTIVYFAMQFAAVPYFALVPEVVPNEKLGTANAFFSAFGGIGTVVAYMVLLALVYKVNKPYAFYAFAAAHLLCTIITVLFTKEHISETPPPKINKASAMAKGIADLLRDMPEYPDLTRFLIANLFFWLSLGSFINFFTKYMEYYVNIPGTQAGLVLGTVVIISILLAVPVGILADKMSRKKLAVAGMVLIFAGLLVGYFTIGPRSVVSAKDLASGSDVLKLADKLSISAAGVDLTLFEKKDFTPKFDVNKDEMFDKKSDVMRWCLNGALEEKDCRGAVEKVMGSSNPSLDSTKTFLVKMRAEIVSKTKPVLTISYIVIAFTAIGLTMCFLIMAAILPTLMPMEKMGLYMGFYSSVTGAGQLLSLAVAGFMIDFTLARNIGGLGYRWIFIQGIVCMAIAALTMNSVPYVPNANEPTVSELKKAKQAGTLK